MDQLLTLVILWISANFGLPGGATHPQIVAVPPGSLAATRAELARGPSGAPHPAEASLQPELHAFYHVGSRTIYLSDDWRPDTAAGLSVLVHEAVHHLQAEAGVAYPCAGQREKLAYDAQDRWLRQFGTSLAEEFGIDALTRLSRTACPR